MIDGQTEILAMQEELITVNDDELSKQDEELSQAEQTLSDNKDNVRQEKETLQITKDAITAGKAEIEKQKDHSRDLNIKILSKEQVKDLPEPEMTFDKKYYKVPKQDYKRLLATAVQADVVKQQYEKKRRLSTPEAPNSTSGRLISRKAGGCPREKKRNWPYYVS